MAESRQRQRSFPYVKQDTAGYGNEIISCSQDVCRGCLVAQCKDRESRGKSKVTNQVNKGTYQIKHQGIDSNETTR